MLTQNDLDDSVASLLRPVPVALLGWLTYGAVVLNAASRVGINTIAILGAQMFTAVLAMCVDGFFLREDFLSSQNQLLAIHAGSSFASAGAT